MDPVKKCSVDEHVVEIPVDNSSPYGSPAKHPLQEISDSGGHLLLLKLWQREDEIIGHRIALKESKFEQITKDIYELCCLYFLFHGFVLTLVFTAATLENEDTCMRWWIPSTLSFIACLVIICAIQYKTMARGRVLKMLQTEKSESRALCRCIQELRMKGISFDLSKEPQTVKRMKSSSVQTKFRPLRWCSQSFVTIVLTVTSGFIVAACKLIACS